MSEEVTVLGSVVEEVHRTALTPKTASITISDVNDAPILGSNVASFSGITEDEVTKFGEIPFKIS